MADQLGDDLRTGLLDIDEHHRQLLATVDRLGAGVRAGDDDGKLAETFAAFEAHVRQHFSAESEYMVASHYPGLARHRREHEALAAYVSEVHTIFIGTRPAADRLALLALVGNKLRRHTETSDRTFADYIQTKFSQARREDGEQPAADVR